VARLKGGGTCTAAELAAAVGPDTARYALLRARPGSRPALDLSALATATDANPAYRVRFAHARLCALARHAEALGIEPSDGLLDADLAELIAAPAPDSPYRTARWLESLASAVERVEPGALPKGDQPVTDTHRARLAQCARAREALADGLRRLDLTAPERM
jgi:arginyl-tRNA synthetase